MSKATTTLQALCAELAQIAPLRLAESWDNVGLLVGDRRRPVTRVMTCLTISPNVVDEAIAENADLIIAHHPLPFKPLQKITTDSVAGSMLLKLIGENTAIYSAHTAFDSAAQGINQRWAELLRLESIEPLVVLGDVGTADDQKAQRHAADDLLEPQPSIEGSGRIGVLPESTSLEQLVGQAARAVGAAAPKRVGPAGARVSKVGLACGSGGSFLAAARRRGCDVLITGEATFHTCLEAESLNIGLGLLGHYWSERFAMEKLAENLSGVFPDLAIWPSADEHDPIETVTL